MFIYKFIVVGMLMISSVSLSFGQKVALNFDGSDDVVQTSFPGIAGTAARTIEAWVRTTANCDPNNGGKQKVITDWGSTATGGRFTVNLLFGNAARIEVGGSGLTAKTSVNDGKWHHIAVVYDPTATDNFRILVDGTLDVSGNITTTVNTASSVKMLIGQRVDGVNNFDGDIDEVRVYNVVRSDSAIKADMDKEYCSLPSGIVAYYKLNEGNAGSNNSSRKKAIDYSGSGYTGDLTNFALSGSGSNWITGPSLMGGDSKSTITEFACDSLISPSGNSIWYFTGTFFDTIPNAYQCDSFITVKLTIGKSNIGFSASSCDSFTSPGGVVYYRSGSYTENYKSVLGCDSIIRYEVKINESKSVDIFETSCDSFITPEGYVHYKTGQNSEKYILSSGCDSVVSYHVTINHSAQTNESVSVCDSILLDKEWRKKSGDIFIMDKTSLGCDSSHTIQLTIHQSNLFSQTVSGCDSFISASGKAYLTSGSYHEMFKNQMGCDSVLAYEVTINQHTVENQQIEACDSTEVDGKWYFDSEKFTRFLTTKNGCDSLVKVDLSIITINTNIAQNGDELTSQEANADEYQWVDCKTNLPINGATNAIYKSRYNGSFKVNLTKKNCNTTSDCKSITTAWAPVLQDDIEVQVYPNPNRGTFNIRIANDHATGSLAVINSFGSIVMTEELTQSDEYSISFPLAPGIYFIRIQTSKGVLLKKFMVQPQ